MSRQAFGDWQTPLELAREALAVVVRQAGAPATVVEPTCGEGSFLAAAGERFPEAALRGWELNPAYAAAAGERVPGARVEVADFFAVDWDAQLAELPQPILVVGNPPWVTNATLGVLESDNLPAKRNFKRQRGYDALTGKSNFDISEWMLLRLLEALQGKRATVAVLCKTAVARRVIEHAASQRWDVQPGGLWRIDAMRHFRAAVDAVLLVCEVGGERAASAAWPIHPALDARTPSSTMVVVDGAIVADGDLLARTAHLAGSCEPQWRSGLKHDCARVMELERGPGGWTNGLGEAVDVEDAVCYPLLKSSDVARGEARRERAVIVPQRALGEDTAALATTAPRAWRYLSAHAEQLRARKSSIYRGQPDFAVFGIGPYSFAPWKVAVSGLYKRCAFTLVGPRDGQPVMLDDTCYFLPFATEDEATAALAGLRSRPAQDFFAARIFWDAKRPINKAVLQQLDLATLLAQRAA